VTVAPEIARSKQISLTTYRKDGTPVATPVWQAMDGEEMLTVSEAGAWKVKRIRNNSRVLVTPCSISGKVAPGAPSVEGTARLLDDEGTEAARKLLQRRYVSARIGNWLQKTLHLRQRPGIGIAVRFD
jgi:PPOX class probable F420-dependent enzyme